MIINGEFQIAQRNTSISNSTGIYSVDRFGVTAENHNESPDQAQLGLSSSDTGPWAKGHRYAYQITNGNQTGGAGTSDRMEIYTNLEARDIASSGWDYTSTSSYITLSFWVKSSVAQNFYGYIQTFDGSGQRYPFETGSLSANTWAKITKTIPGNSNITVDSNNEKGLAIIFTQFLGTGLTGSTSLNTWAAWDTAVRTPDQTSTWYTTNDATFAITGVQLEVGDIATDYEHKRYNVELLDCQRYYEEVSQHENGGMPVAIGQGNNDRKGLGYINFKVTKRIAPTAPNVSIGIDGGDANHTCVFHTTTSGTTIKSSSSTDIGNADITTGAWTAKFSAEL